MKFIKHKIFESIISGGAIFMMCMLFTACVQEYDGTSSTVENPGDMVTVEFSVPFNDSFGATVSSRAGEDNQTYGDDINELDGDDGNKVVTSTNQEGWLSNLYLIAIKEKDGDGNVSPAFNVYELDTSGYNPQVGEDKTPSKFYVNMYPGTYRFYMVANFDRYLDRFRRVTNIQDEDALKDIYLNFEASMPLVPAHLPMAAEPGDFSGVDFTGVEFKIEKVDNRPENKKYEINAKLHFICSKVRYTILYNNTVGGCSEQFGNNSIRFIVNQTSDRPKAKDIRNRTYFYSGATHRDFNYIAGEWILELNRYKYPKNQDGSFNENYPESSSHTLEPWEDQPNLSQWKASTQRVWQGVTYLPENNDPNKCTGLYFPYVMEKYKGADGNYEDAVLDPTVELPEKSFSLFGNSSDVHYGPDYEKDPLTEGYSTGLRRGYFYDVVAKVKNISQDDLEMYIQVYVGTQPWIYHEYDQNW